MFFPASLIAAATLAAGSVVAGIGFAALAQADTTDDEFIQALDSYGLQYGRPEKAMLVAQVYVCGQLDANPGETINDVVSGVANNTNWSNADSAFFTGTAIAAYCPQYKSIVNATTTTDVPTDVPIS
jgi:hypothetical protein